MKRQRGRPVGSKSLPVEKFIQIWQSSASAKEAGERAGFSATVASVRAGRLRRRGVPMKLMPRGLPEWSAEHIRNLAKLAKSLEQK